MGKFSDSLKHAYNAFVKPESEGPTQYPFAMTTSYGGRPDRVRMTSSNERSIISSIYTRLSIDIAAISLKHVRLDDNNNYLETIYSGLNNCLTLEANIDQGGRHFRQNIATTLFDKGVVAIVPVDTSINPMTSGGYDISTMRVGEIMAWYPKHVRVNLYDDNDGKFHELVLPKSIVAIVENPLYSVMNEPNSTLQRLIRKLNLLDTVDEASSSGKLDLIIQLPYVVKSEARQQQAEARRTAIEMQLKGSKYGIAYTDGTEKITQLNRPAENQLLTQVEYLTNMLYGQLGLTSTVFDGTADEATMINYYNRTIDPILGAISEAMSRTFLTKTARTQKQAVSYYRNPFTLVSSSDLAEIADKFTRNEILSSNEVRAIIGFSPSKDPNADTLRNKNLPQPMGDPNAPQVAPDTSDSGSAPVDDGSAQNAIVNNTLSDLESSIDKIIAGGNS